MNPTKQPPKVTTSVVFDRDQFDALADEAAKANTSMSVVVRSLVRRWQLEQQSNQEVTHA